MKRLRTFMQKVLLHICSAQLAHHQSSLGVGISPALQQQLQPAGAQSFLRVSPWHFGLGRIRSSRLAFRSIPFRGSADWHEPAMEERGKERNSSKRPRATLAGGGGGSAAAAAAWRTCRVARAAAGGKDRHSKVVTARGLRDRRVRLSVPTAIQFYDIQDRLGVDQPSKAIEWLIRAASPAIDALPSLDYSFVLPASPPADEARENAEVSTSETSKTSVLSLANAPGDNGHATTAAAHQANDYNGSANGAFAELLYCSSNDKPMQQQPTLAYYAAQSSHIAPMSFEMVPYLAFSKEQQHPAVAFDRGTLQSNAVVAPLWPPSQHPCLTQRFAAPGDAAVLPFFLGGGAAAAAPATANAAERRLQLWDFKEERKI